MNLSSYMDNSRGIGILSTSGIDGEVNGAVYARPHVLGEDTVGFVMRDRLSRANLQQNSHAHFLFVEEGGKSSGIRLHLDMVGETDDSEHITEITRKKLLDKNSEKRYFVTFKIRKALQLLGGDEISLN